MRIEAAVDTAAVDHVMRDTTVAQVKKNDKRVKDREILVLSIESQDI